MSLTQFMPPKSKPAAKPAKGKTATSLRHDAKRKNLPTVEYESLMRQEDKSPIEVAYERRSRDLDQQFVWRGKDDEAWSSLVVPAPPMYIQEKVHPKVLIDDLQRQFKARAAAVAPQTDLFADFNGLPNDARATEFYQPDASWANRTILGDSLQVRACLAAYGQPTTLTDAEILERLVALNAERAKEEANGLIRWLRPEYQNPGGAKSHQGSLAVDTDTETRADKKRPAKEAKVPWPPTLSARVKAVTKLLAKTKDPLAADEVASRFTGARRTAVAGILETLVTMGHAHRGKTKGIYLP